MEELIAFEYQRIWLSERDEWARKTFAPKNHRLSQRRDSKNIQKVGKYIFNLIYICCIY